MLISSRGIRGLGIRLVPFAALASIAMSPVVSSAATDCTSGITISANTSLTTDYEHSGSGVACITLTNGADLNMNGHKITCKGSYLGHCATAVRATSTGSTVNNSVPSAIAIDGVTGAGWDIAVKDVQVVDDLRIQAAFLGISGSNVTRISGNVISNVASCIEATMTANTAIIKNNLCSTDFPGSSYEPRTGIAVTGTTSGSGPVVERNLVTHAQLGIYGDDRLRIRDNINCNETAYYGFGMGVVVDAAQLQTGSHNLCCDAPEDTTNSDCGLMAGQPGGFNLWP